MSYAQISTLQNNYISSKIYAMSYAMSYEVLNKFVKILYFIKDLRDKSFHGKDTMLCFELLSTEDR
jgi:hypothetical protein